MPAEPDRPLVTRDDFRRLEKQVADLLAMLGKFGRDQQTQFARITQLQADIDLIGAAWTKVTSPPDLVGDPYAGPERRQKPR